jgi:2-polyprenyl-6-methoxyphenol hydroxylase-like FAD-dependent oxidoreductase
MYDAIVVGARCAGAPTAMLLGRKGRRVLLLDRSTFPSDLRQSTLLIHQPGVSFLERWGLLRKVRSSGAPLITRRLVDLGALSSRGLRYLTGERRRRSPRDARFSTRSCWMLPPRRPSTYARVSSSNGR